MLPSIQDYLDEETVVALFEKVAEAAKKKPEHPALTGVKLLGKSIASMAVGGAAGLGAAYGAEKLYKHYTGKPIPLKYLGPASAIVGGGAIMADRALRERQMEIMRDAIKDYKNRRRTSG